MNVMPDTVAFEVEPHIELQLAARRREDETGYWRTSWVIENKGAAELKILTVRLPHSQFKSEELRFEPALRLAAQASDRFHVRVRCHEPAGLVTENAFVILSVVWLGEAWRIFVRLRVVVSPEGEPETATEMTTAHKSGFSGIAS